MEMKPMNKYEFLSRLRNALSALPNEERDAAMSYYEEFFSDAGEDNEQAVIASLGTPEELARSIISENTAENVKTETESNFGSNYSSSHSRSERQKMDGRADSPVCGIGGVFRSFFAIGGGGACIINCGIFCLNNRTYGGLRRRSDRIACGRYRRHVRQSGSGNFSVRSEPYSGRAYTVYPLCKAIFKLAKTCAKGISALFNRLTGRKEIIQ